MKILEVGILNLNSLNQHIAIDFLTPPLSDSGLFAIVGDTGSGKTTILDAITLALFGRIHRNKDAYEVMSYGAYEAFAEVKFENDGDVYLARWTIRRAGKKPEGKLQPVKRFLSKWDELTQSFKIIGEKVKEIDSLVVEITGLDFKRFCRSVLLSQGDFAAFLKSDVKEQGELLERITGTEIYSDISQTVFLRHKLERETLQKMLDERDAKEVLGEEEMKEVKGNLKLYSTDSNELNHQLIRLRKETENREKLFLLQKELKIWSEKNEALKLHKTTVNEQIIKYEQCKKAAAFKELFFKYDNYAKQLKSTREAISVLKNDLDVSTGNEKKIEAEHANVQKKLIHFKQEKKEKERILEDVVKLDLKIKERQKPVKQLYDEQEGLKTKINAKSIELKKRAVELNEDQRKLSEATVWLDENGLFKSLSSVLPLINKTKDDLREVYKSERDEKKKLQEFENNWELFKIEKAAFDKVEHELKAREAGLAKISQQWTKEGEEFNSQILSNVLSKKIENDGVQLNLLEKAKELFTQHAILSSKLKIAHERYDHIQTELLKLKEVQVLKSKELKDLEEQVEFKQAVYEQQMSISNYESDRAKLQEGEPCPICFSTVHPFRKKEIRPYVDRAKMELEEVKKQMQLLHAAIQEKNKMEVKLMHEQLLLGGDGKEKEGEINEVLKEMKGLEARFSKLNAQLNNKVEFKDQEIETRILQLQEALKQLNIQREQLLIHIEKLATLESQLRTHNKQNQMMVQRASELKISRKHLDENLARIDKEKSKIISVLNEHLAPFEMEFKEETAKALFEKLAETAETYAMQNSLKESLENTIKLKMQSRDQETVVLKELKENQLSVNERYTSENEALMALRKERIELFGEADPEETKLELAKKMEAIESSIGLLQESRMNINAKVKSIADQLKSREMENQDLVHSKVMVEKAIAQKIEHSAFTNFEEIRSALLPEEEMERIENLMKSMEEEKTKLLTQKNSIDEEILKVKEGIDESLSDEVATLKLKDKEQEYATLQQKIGALQNVIAVNEQKRKALKTLLKSVKKQEKEVGRWAKLNDLIGSADGKKFRQFAQGLTLQKLVFLANIHLSNLNGRYYIKKKAGENLALDIVDTFQADNLRSMNTLSGGESFLVSLALALGLSDMAGRSTNIRSLFIDEGFGTLDENTLDLAITTLENLQAEGKTIGVISHVKTLKERISTQIQLIQKGSGVSEIKVVA